MNWVLGEREKVLDFAKSLDFVVRDDKTETTLEDIINDYKSFGLIDKNKDTNDVLDKIWDPVLEK